MADVADIKATLILAAYTGACAVCEPLINEPTPPGGTIPVDPLIQDLGLQAKGTLVYEEAKVQYAAILRAFADQTGIWPNPVLPSSGAGTTPQRQQTPAQQTAAVSAALQKLLSQLPAGSSLTTVGAFLQALSQAATPATPTQPASTTPAQTIAS